MFELERSVVIVGIAGACLIGAFFAGVKHEHNKNEAAKNKAVVERVAKVQTKQAETSTEINKAGNEYEEKYFALNLEHQRTLSELGKLRIKRPACMPAAAGTASARNAPSEESTVRPGAGEINLDGIAGQVIELGKDLDDSNLRIEELKSLVVAYQKACTVQ